MVTDFLASRGEGGSGLPHVSTGARTRGPVRGGAGPAGEADVLQPPPHAHAPVTRQSSDALPPDARPATDRSGGEGEARLVLDHEARHDRLVSIPPPVEGVQRGAGDQDTQPFPRPEPEPDTWLIEASSYQSQLREIWHPKLRMPLDSGGEDTPGPARDAQCSHRTSAASSGAAGAWVCTLQGLP